MGWNEGSDPENGLYLPFEDILLDDLVTVNTGSGQFDLTDQDFPVAAITISMRQGGDWDAWVDLGSSFSAATTRQFRVVPTASHNHPPNPELCRPGAIGATFAAYADLGDATSNDGTNEASDFPAWSGDREERVEISLPVGVPAGHSIIAWIGTNIDGGQGALYDHQVYDEQGNTWTLDATSPDQGSNDIVVEIWRCNVTNALSAGDYIRFAMNVGASLSTTSETGRRTIGAYAFTGMLSSPVAGTEGNAFNGTPAVASSGTGGLVVAGALTGGGTLSADGDWTTSFLNNLAGNGHLLGQFLIPGANESFGPGYSGSSTDWTITSVAYTTSSGEPTAGDGHPDLVGTGRRAARCGHAHHVLRAAAPTVDDDSDDGYPVTTDWTDTTTGRRYLLTDNSAGAAVWIESTPKLHASSHANGGADEVAVESLAAAETDTSLRLAPDGAGGVEFVAGVSPGAGTTVYALKDANESFSTTTLNNSTGLSFAVAANTNYRFRFVVFFLCNASTVGIKLSVNGPTGTYRFGAFIPASESTSSGAIYHGSGGAADSGGTASATAGPTIADLAILEGVVRVGGSGGTLVLRHGSETATSTTILANSYGELTEI